MNMHSAHGNRGDGIKDYVQYVLLILARAFCC
jgi:hypothetical protein